MDDKEVNVGKGVAILGTGQYGSLGEFCPLTTKLIVDCVARGMTTRLACTCAGISVQRFYKWLDKGRKEKDGVYRDFLIDVGNAEMRAVAVHLDNINNAAMAGDWRASAWILEHRHPMDYGK